ncbi:hypothetical protein N657DRAFT_692413 [Parathielavia appendiculata]|uniref:Uncharacterized protein n=1 Tax=Parathielavia appendiculata TaxID=2587402 RepID=A0AAN6Z1E8_9PEZI|nr:hypothetical protein N657DRAFT_692413 [Parathielavia appendiculata]
MDTDQTDANLLFLSVNLSDSEPDEAATPITNTTTTITTIVSSTDPTSEHQPTRAERTALSQEAFQALKQSYRPKVENGNIHKTIPLPLPDSPTPLSKPEAQALLHAAEELYFFRQYSQAVDFIRRILDGDGGGKGTREGVEEEGRENRARKGSGGSGRIDDETSRLLRYYLARCLARLEEGQGEEEEV